MSTAIVKTIEKGYGIEGGAQWLSGIVDPSAGAGIAASISSEYWRNNSGTREKWVKTDVSDTDWVLESTGSSSTEEEFIRSFIGKDGIGSETPNYTARVAGAAQQIGNTDDLELAIAKIDEFVANSVVLTSGANPLVSDWDIGDGRAIWADIIRARDGDGLQLLEDGGEGLTVNDGGNSQFSKDLTITGNLTVNGDFVKQNVEILEIEDNLGIINFGESGAGITAGYAGWEVDRGTSESYRWGFNESNDAFELGIYYQKATGTKSSSFTLHEEVIQATTNAKGYVFAQDGSSISLKGITGSFNDVNIITGQTSGETVTSPTMSTTDQLQPMMTREDSPIDTGIFYWNNSNVRAETDTGFLYDSTNKALSIRSIQSIYVPDQTDFIGSIFYGTGGLNLTHASGFQAQNNTGGGIGALFKCTSGQGDTAGGFNSLRNLLVGLNDTAFGNRSGESIVGGSYDTCIGMLTLAAYTNQGHGIGLGYAAGRYETVESRLFIDGHERATEAAGRTKSLIYGGMDGTPTMSNQFLNVNGLFQVNSPANGSHRFSVEDDGVHISQVTGGSYHFGLEGLSNAHFRVQKESSGEMDFTICSKNGNGNVNVGLTLFGVGIGTLSSNRESVSLWFNNVDNRYYLQTEHGGTGVVRDLVIMTSGNLNQLFVQYAPAGEGHIGMGTAAPSSRLDIEYAGTVKTNTDFLELTNKGNAADMDGTETSILFNQWFLGGFVAQSAARISVGTEQDWTTTASTRDSYMTFHTALDGVVSEKVRITSEGVVKINEAGEYAGKILVGEGGDVRFRYIDNPINFYLNAGTNDISTLWLCEGAGFSGASGASLQFDGATNKFHIRTASSAAHTEKFTILRDSGYIGMGTTSPSSLLDLEGAGTVKTNINLLELTNKANDVDMDGTETSILFNKWYYDAVTPAVANAARITVGTENDWTVTANTQDSYMSLYTVTNGSLVEKMRIDQYGVNIIASGTKIVSPYALSVQRSDNTACWIEILNNAGTGKGAFFGIDINDFQIFNWQGGNISFWTNPSASAGTERMTIMPDGKIGVGISASMTSLFHIDQSSSTGALPVLALDQGDVSEEFINFIGTIAAGNSIEAVGAKTFTPTHFLKIQLNGALKYLQIGDIA